MSKERPCRHSVRSQPLPPPPLPPSPHRPFPSPIPPTTPDPPDNGPLWLQISSFLSISKDPALLVRNCGSHDSLRPLASKHGPEGFRPGVVWPTTRRQRLADPRLEDFDRKKIPVPPRDPDCPKGFRAWRQTRVQLPTSSTMAPVRQMQQRDEISRGLSKLGRRGRRR